MGNLWTPDRDISLDTKTVQHASAKEMAVLRDLHAVAHRLGGIVVLCRKCDKAFQGLNSGHGSTQSIQCGCREIKAEVGGRIVQATS